MADPGQTMPQYYYLTTEREGSIDTAAVYEVESKNEDHGMILKPGFINMNVKFKKTNFKPLGIICVFFTDFQSSFFLLPFSFENEKSV